jgi:hypothetical protein
MGWWRIDPETGMPEQNAYSKLSQPGRFHLLNAVPGVDDDAAAYYLGDSPWDLAADTARQVQELLGSSRCLSKEETRRLFLERILPQGIGISWQEPLAAPLLQIVDSMRCDVDECYQEAWGRPTHPAEWRWVCEYAAKCLAAVDE